MARASALERVWSVVRAAAGGTVWLMRGAVSQDPETATVLAAATAACEEHRAAQLAEVDLLNDRDRAIVRAIRAGARLEEAAEAAAISRAAVSKAARRTLPRRTGRGGPYSRRRGSSAALSAVAGASQDLAAARKRAHEVKRQRDEKIANAVASGATVSEVARAIGMTPASVSVIARSCGRRGSTTAGNGAVASRLR